MVVIFEPASQCDLGPSGIVLNPLPARKQLWETDSAAKWVAEIEREPGQPVDYAMTANGDLVRVIKDSGAVAGHGVQPWPKVDWGEWLSRMDSLGGLVTLAASFVG